jgi:hypothetical protein
MRTLLLSMIFAGLGAAPAGAQPSTPAQLRAVLDRYCAGCHNDKVKTAGLSLSGLNFARPEQNAETWEKVARKLRTRAMPPPRLPHPDEASYNELAGYLENAMDRAASNDPNPGRPGMHRLNRAEYANAVRDLLAVNVNAESLLPPDDSAYGFDNVGSVLTVSPILLERYLSAAGKVSRLAVGESRPRPEIYTYQAPEQLVQSGRMDEDLPFGSRAGAVFVRDFPANGEYLIRIRLLRDDGVGGVIRGVALHRRLDLRLDGARVKLFAFGGEQKGKSGSTEQEEYERGADTALEFRLPVLAGPHRIGATFMVEQSSEPEGVYRPAVVGLNSALRAGKTSEPWIDSVSIDGPFNPTGPGETPSRRRIFGCHSAPEASGSQEELCATRILSALARQAYRRPVGDSDVDALLKFYRLGRSQGDFEQGIRVAIERMLVSVNFLFRTESEPPNLAPRSNYRIADVDLASRLSFFLWSSIPDEELINLAEHGRLHDPAVLSSQVQRMIHDPRFQAFSSNFFGQWLQLRQVPNLTPDPIAFPSFDENLRQAFERETGLFLESMLNEDHPLMDLVNANYTFVNEDLALHYDIPNVHGSSFRRVTLPDDRRRGLLGQGSILALTSYATRTSVVLRGVWVLDNILGTPPAPPPPIVPDLKERTEDGRFLSVRRSMELHRASPVCASCHARIDPIGFALENFDGIGKWRATEGPEHAPIDSSGSLPDGTRIEGPAELRNVLLAHPDQFATVVIEKLLTYALGRSVEYYDQPAVRKIVRDGARDNYRWSSLISDIVRSEPFQMRRSSP